MVRRVFSKMLGTVVVSEGHDFPNGFERDVIVEVLKGLIGRHLGAAKTSRTLILVHSYCLDL